MRNYILLTRTPRQLVASHRLRLIPFRKSALDIGYQCLCVDSIFNLLYLFFRPSSNKFLFYLSKEFGIYGLLVSLLPFNSKQLVIDICDIPFLSNKQPFFLKIIKFFISQYILSKAVMVICPTRTIKRYLSSIYRHSNIVVIPDYVDIDSCVFDNRSLALPSQDLNIGWFGNSGYTRSYFNLDKFFPSLSLLSFIRFCSQLPPGDPVNIYVCSNNHSQVSRLIKQQIPHVSLTVLPYSINNVKTFFKTIDVCILSYGISRSTSTKSLNRLDLLLAQGIPTLLVDLPPSLRFDIESDYNIVYTSLNSHYLPPINSGNIYSFALRSSHQFTYNECFVRDKNLSISSSYKNLLSSML